MHVVGIIVEYNPFHLGHLYQISEVKKKYPKSVIIVVMSSCFMQRGEVSIMTKWDKTRVALENGIDLVVELPFAYASQSSDIFAKGALDILSKLKINTLVFGSECNDIDYLERIAKIQIEDNNFNILVNSYLKNGNNYPTALSLAINDKLGSFVNSPNDLLAISYIKEIIKNRYNINYISIKRTNDYHGKNIDNNIASASYIRKLFHDDLNVDNYLPNNCLDKLIKVDNNDFFPLLKYQIINNINCLDRFQTVDEGIHNRIIKCINEVDNFYELVTKIKTKRYTYNKINRMLIHILTSFTKEEASLIKVDYIRLLGFNDNGKDYLNKIKKDVTVPLVTHYKKDISLVLDIEYRITCIYDIVVKKDLVKKEYSQIPLRK